jgi:hypothetical protein
LADKISTAIIPWYDFSSISSRFSAKYQKKAENKAKTYRARINATSHTNLFYSNISLDFTFNDSLHRIPVPPPLLPDCLGKDLNTNPAVDSPAMLTESHSFKLTGVVSLDIRKAFNSIDHVIPLEKLAFYGVSQLELASFQSHLSNRQQQCQVNGCLSNKGEIICGIPQGSILGPLLFLIYINDLPNSLKTITPCLCADDNQISASSHDSVE